MTYTEAKRAEYPPQDEKRLLIGFTAELLARRKFESAGHAGVNFEDWIGADKDAREERMEQFTAHAETLAALGMLTWPDTETPGFGWTVEGPGQMRGLNAAPALDWIQPFGRNPKKAIAYFRACRTTGQPCRLSWSFSAKKGFDLV
jgi:sugar phosphate isomerase/epimerase